jgi:hypothetical protein
VVSVEKSCQELRVVLLALLGSQVRRAHQAWSVPRAVVERQVRLVPRALVPSKAKGDLQAPEVSQERKASLAEMAEMANAARRAREVPKEPAVPVDSREAKA